MNLHPPSRFLLLLTIVTASNTRVDLQAQSAAVGPLQINVSDRQGDSLPFRIHLRDSDNVPQKAFGQPFWNDHFVCAGRVAVDLTPGTYRYEIERGPEYERVSGEVTVAGESKELSVTLSRIANNHMCRSRMLENEAWGKPRDANRLPAPRGNGFWSQEIYYHLLNCGIEMPPSAGSASGVLPNPVGYNRVYAHLNDGVAFSRDSWFDALSRGNSFVTNGPLLIAEAEGRIPGNRITIAGGQKRRIKIEVRLTSRDPVSQIEVTCNGVIAATAACSDQITQQRSMEVELDGAGWFLVRAIANVEETFRFASTAPWFVDTEGGDRRVSKTSAQFFLDWTRERIGRVQASVIDPNRLREVLRPHEQAEAYWLSKVNQANSP